MTACLLPSLYTELMLEEKSLSSRLLSLGSELHGLIWASPALSCSVRKTNCPSLCERNKDSIFCFGGLTQTTHLTSDRRKRMSYQHRQVFITLRWNLQGWGIQRPDVGLVYKSSATRRAMGSYKHTQALEQETLDLHSITTAQLKLI